MPLNLDLESLRHGKELVKRGFARMQKGGVIMDVVNAEQAAIAENAGAVSVMALERVPADIRADGGVARMSDPSMIKEIIDFTTIPVERSCGDILTDDGACWDWYDHSTLLCRNCR